MIKQNGVTDQDESTSPLNGRKVDEEDEKGECSHFMRYPRESNIENMRI